MMTSHLFTQTELSTNIPHPKGPDSDTCLDFEPDPALKGRYFKDFLGLQRQQNPEPDEILWEPEGASYYNGELLLQPRHC